ncbi:hypothetical protein G6F37_000052 [Rhizopus arrhizus]|nr:hypothetical protein G6F37_000052 [Rhizopus arrhizus]
MPWSQVVTRKRTSVMNATFENNTHNTYGLNCETISITNCSRKIAEINFDPLDPAIDHILKDGINFENDAVRLLPCRALDPAVPLVRLRLSNLPFLKEDILKEQLKMSLEPYGFVLDLGSYENPTPAPIWYQSEDEGFYAMWSDMPTCCRYCHTEGHVVPDCPKKRSSRVCWNCRTSGHIAADCTKR